MGHGLCKAKAFDNLAHFLGSQVDAFYAYFLTFLILWIVWRQHYADNPMATLLYGVVVAVVLFSRPVWWTPWAGSPWLFTSLFATLVRSVVGRRRLRSAPV